MDAARYLVVGGGLCGLNALRAIRERDPDGRIVLISREPHLPYDRVPLSKGYLLGKVRRDVLFPKKEPFFSENRVELMLGRSVVELDAGGRSATLDGGEKLSFEKVLLATGGVPKRLPIPGSQLAGVSYLRTVDDCEWLRSELSQGKRVAVVGGGFIGCEVASAAAAMGNEVTVVEALPHILSLAFDPETSEWIEEELRSIGIRILTGTPAAEFMEKQGRVAGVVSKAGDVVPIDIVVVGVGLRPSTELAERAGLRVENGVVTDEMLQTDREGVFAAGDVANFLHPLYGRRMRLEHYDVAVKQGRLAGANMVGAGIAFAEPPYFFSFLPRMSISAYGDIALREEVVRRGELSRDGFFQFFFAGGRLRGFVSVNRPPTEIRAARALLQAQFSAEMSERLSDRSRTLEELAREAQAGPSRTAAQP